MRIYGVILISLIVGNLKSQHSVKLGLSAGLSLSRISYHFRDDFGQIQNLRLNAVDIVTSPGVFVHKDWGNFGLYLPFSMSFVYAKGGITKPCYSYFPIYIEMGIHPGNRDVTFHYGYGYSLQFSTINKVYNGLHEVHLGFQYKKFDSRLSLGEQHTICSTRPRFRICLGIYYYLRK